MANLQHLSNDAQSSEIVELLHSDGGVIIDNVINSSVLKKIKDELSPFLDLSREGNDEFTGTKTKRVGALIARSLACGELALHPLINQACNQFLSPHSNGYQLHFSQAVSIGKDESRQALHRDRYVWGSYVPKEIETQFSTIWALSDFTMENGATQVVPFSHLWEEVRTPNPEEIAYAEMSAGSVLIYSGSTIHGGGANTTSNPRTGVLLHYTLNWLRQEENQYLSCPPEFARKLSKELRQLIGYTQGGPVLGFYSSPEKTDSGFDLRSPERLFE